MNSLKKFSGLALAFLLTMGFLSGNALASEIDLKIPSLDVGYNIFGHAITGSQILFYGMWICVLGMIFGFWEFIKNKKAGTQINACSFAHHLRNLQNLYEAAGQTVGHFGTVYCRVHFLLLLLS